MKVCIDPGHGGSDPGAVYRGVAEKLIVLPTAIELAKILKLWGHEVKLTRIDDSFPTLSQRVATANAWPADIMISLHMNADRDSDMEWMPEARGAEIWWWKDEDKELAEHLEVGIRRVYPEEPFRGLKQGAFYVLRKSKMPTVLVELAFLDNSESLRRMTYRLEQRESAYALALGLLRREQMTEQGTVFE